MELEHNHSTASPFDAVRKTREDGTEFWSARDLMPLLGYDKWERFKGSIERARLTLTNQGQDPDMEASRSREAFGKTRQVGENYHLTRYAAYPLNCEEPANLRSPRRSRTSRSAPGKPRPLTSCRSPSPCPRR